MPITSQASLGDREWRWGWLQGLLGRQEQVSTRLLTAQRGSFQINTCRQASAGPFSSSSSPRQTTCPLEDSVSSPEKWI